MIPLRGRSTSANLCEPLRRTLWRLTSGDEEPARGCAQLVEHGTPVREGFGLYLARHGHLVDVANVIELPPAFDYLQPGDVLRIAPNGEQLRVLWRKASPFNSVLLTERCDHYCIMCSQPPKRVDDDWLLDEAFTLVKMLPPTTNAIGFTGGEPTLYGDRLIELLKLCTQRIPLAGVHVLSNGRRFADPRFAEAWASINNPELMVGIPIYGPESMLHDYVVQAENAFDETVRGVLNLGALGQRIEIRVVIHKQTAPSLVEIAEFISRNLPFVDQVALMGLEVIGFARANLDDVWIDPVDYAEQLSEAVSLLARKRIRTLVYNHQLCLVDPGIWPFTVKSISDWKNEYHPECLRCSLAEECGGFFYSAKYRYSDHIRAINPTERLTPLPLLELSTS
jgi:His-Xaa-Ser system radical SAM maturase HxsC